MEERKSLKEEKVVIPKETLAKYEDKAARRIARRVRIPGFRPGKAPISVVKQKFAKEVREEAILEALNEEVKRIVDERGWKLVSSPRIKAQSDEGDAYEFTVEFEIYPEIHIPDLTQVKVKKRIRQITDAHVEERIQEFKEENATLQPVDREVREGDVVLAEFFIRKDGKEGQRRRARIYVRANELDEDLYNAILGKKAGDEIVLPGEEGEEEVYVIKNVYEVQYPSDEELAELLGYPPDRLREKIREELIEEAQKEAESELEMAIIQELLRLSPFDPPPSLVYEVYKQIRPQIERQVPPEEVEEAAVQNAAFLVARDLLILKLIEDRELDITDEEIIQYLKEEGVQNPESFLKEAKRRGKYDELRNRYLIRKAYDYLKQTVQIEPEFV
ncbi:MAG: trigger factor [Thermotogae bacterium]|nr:trigger factor [Thermotogota bacterium]